VVSGWCNRAFHGAAAPWKARLHHPLTTKTAGMRDQENWFHCLAH